MLPRYRVIAIDETDNWDESITAITGRIAGIYVVNFAESIHLCSLEGSYWAEFVCNITENYIREPDGYQDGSPIWDKEFAADFPEDHKRSVTLCDSWGSHFYGLQYENGGEPGMYISGRFREPANELINVVDAGWDQDTESMTPENAETYRRDRDRAAYEAVQEYMNNGEDWQDIAPWKDQD